MFCKKLQLQSAVLRMFQLLGLKNAVYEENFFEKIGDFVVDMPLRPPQNQRLIVSNICMNHAESPKMN